MLILVYVAGVYIYVYYTLLLVLKNFPQMTLIAQYTVFFLPRQCQETFIRPVCTRKSTRVLVLTIQCSTRTVQTRAMWWLDCERIPLLQRKKKQAGIFMGRKQLRTCVFQRKGRESTRLE